MTSIKKAMWAMGLLAAGCVAVTPSQRREETLIREAHMFNDDLRWSRFDSMTQTLSKADGEAFLARASEVGDELVLADHEVTSIKFGSPSETATVLVKVDWYYQREPIVRHSSLEEKWQHVDGKWTVTKLRRLRGDRFPLVPEPIAKDHATPVPAVPSVP